MNIAGRIVGSRQTYKMYQTEKTEWLVIEGELIGVQQRFKDDLGMVVQKFFEPSYLGAPKPHAYTPVVLDARESQAFAINSNGVPYFSEQPKTGAFKKTNFQNLLNTEQVTLIDSKELVTRLQTLVASATSRHKVCKAKERTRSTLDTKRLSPQEVLRASNRPKSKANMLPNQRKPRPAPDPASILKPRKIIYRQEQTPLPLNEDVLLFYNSNKAITRRPRIEAELDTKKTLVQIEPVKKCVPKLKANLKNAQIKKSVKNAENLNRKKAETERNVWKNAVNIKLDKMNKKLPVGHTKSKSFEDPDRTPRPNTNDQKHMNNAKRPEIRNRKIINIKKSKGNLKEMGKEIKDKGKEKHFIKIEKIKKTKVNDWLEDKTEDKDEVLEIRKNKVNIMKLLKKPMGELIAKKPNEINDMAKEKYYIEIEKIEKNRLDDWLEDETTVDGYEAEERLEIRKLELNICAKLQRPREIQFKIEQPGLQIEEIQSMNRQDWLDNDTDEEEQVCLVGTEDEEFMKAEKMDSILPFDFTARNRAAEKFHNLLCKMRKILIRGDIIANNINRLNMQAKDTIMKINVQKSLHEIALNSLNNIRRINEQTEHGALMLVCRPTDDEAEEHQQVAIYKPTTGRALVKPRFGQSAPSWLQRREPLTAHIPLELQFFCHSYIDMIVREKMSAVAFIELAPRGRCFHII